jgi:hypothetical protein
MREDRDDGQDQGERQDTSEDYVAPTLTDLGSFQELTKFGGSVNPDLEGSS